jgi:adenylate cyclase
MADSPSHSLKAKLGIAAALTAGVCLLVWGLAGPGWLEPYSLKTLDQLHRHLPQPEGDQPVVLITVDQPDVDFFKAQGLNWPWPRQLYATLVDFCRRGGAQAVIFDLLFMETSFYGPEDDKQFARSLQEGGAYLTCFLTRDEKEPNPLAPEALRKAGLHIPGPPPQGVPHYRAVITPIAPLLTAARGLGNVECGPDPDGIYRRLPLVAPFQDRWVPLLGFAPIALQHAPDGWRFEPGALVNGSLRIPVDAQGRLLLKFRGPAGRHPRFSAANVVSSEMRLRQGQKPIYSPAAVAGKWVFVGLTAAGLLDLKACPVSPIYPGVELHATLLDNLLAGDFLRPLPFWMLWAWTGLLALAGALAVLLCSRLWLTLAASLGLATVLTGVTAAAFRAGWWADPVAPALALGFSFAGAAAYSYATEGRQKRAIRRMFSHYLSEAVISHLLAHPEGLKLGGERRRVTLLFSDLADFTSLSERLSPEAVVALLNDYLSRMTEIILAEEGVVDKFEGDAIMAFWGAPLDQPDQAVRACRAALRQQTALQEVNARLRGQGLPPLVMRVGINTGEAIVGNLGSARRFDYTAIGDAVNLASRLEGLNKYYGTAILVSEETAAAARGTLEVMEVDQVAVKGRETPVRVFQVLALAGALSAAAAQAREAFARGLAAYRQRCFGEAARHFDEALRNAPEGKPASALLQRCREFVAAPPPPDWDGVFRPEGK